MVSFLLSALNWVAGMLKGDMYLLLGLIYHFNNIVEQLENIIIERPIIVIEGIFFKSDVGFETEVRDGVNEFDPKSHKDGEPVCSLWLQEYFVQNYYEVKYLAEWEQFVEIPGNLCYNLEGATRKLLIASPQQ